MTVYGEYLFLENFITGLVILVLTGRLCGRKRAKSGMVLGGLMCGAYSFVLFLPMVWPAALICKLIFSLAVILAAFGYGGKPVYLKTVAVFYIVSFLMGGITVGLMYMTKVPGLSANGSVYLHSITYLQVAAGVLVTWVLGSWLAEFIRGKLTKEKVFTDIKVEIAEKEWEMRAFVDTGNFLRDPVSGNPAAVLSASCGQRLLDDLKDAILSRSCVIPYSSVGQKGVLQGLRPDRVIVEGRPIKNIVLAISKEDFACWKGKEAYEVLLQQQIIEGGALENAE
ncbi:sigma-E processing peptidase SpoIIGA [Hominibacterium faecale]|uniref:sigma-E processing peptidase SpoIIGA n=1 Tax=Hominibacterium faecale TaxID=2839743 RepID=UPI0022B2A167|nr:sigma-E processing peptidase SpoIIGA [Hominibacterium faecale]